MAALAAPRDARRDWLGALLEAEGVEEGRRRDSEAAMLAATNLKRTANTEIFDDVAAKKDSLELE